MKPWTLTLEAWRFKMESWRVCDQWSQISITLIKSGIGSRIRIWIHIKVNAGS
jgi:hypothetical protein